jgi:hypothetical protein
LKYLYLMAEVVLSITELNTKRSRLAVILNTLEVMPKLAISLFCLLRVNISTAMMNLVIKGTIT